MILGMALIVASQATQSAQCVAEVCGFRVSAYQCCSLMPLHLHLLPLNCSTPRTFGTIRHQLPLKWCLADPWAHSSEDRGAVCLTAAVPVSRTFSCRRWTSRR